MSYSSEVKDELMRVIPEGRHCILAEIAAIIGLLGKVKISEENKYRLSIRTEHASLARKCFTLLKKAFNIRTDIAIIKSSFILSVRDDRVVKDILIATKFMDASEEISERIQDPYLLSKTCCKRAFLRGCFLASGSISDPEKAYHFEIVFSSLEKAEQVNALMRSLGLESKVVVRKQSYIVYLKESEQIVETLAIMEAPQALIKLENIRIMKDMRNTVNRKVNCETANIKKSVSAGLKQIEDILLLKEQIGLDNIAENLREIALLRLELPDASLKELGENLDPPVGKSGVNHRLRKLSELADKIR